MRTTREIGELLDELNSHRADEFEGQDLDFKRGDDGSLDKAVRTVVDWAECTADGGGGTIVFGVADKQVGRARALLGVPPEIEVHRLQRAGRGDTRLSNKEIRQITRLDRNQVFRLMRELRDEERSVRTAGYGRGARYFWQAENGA